MIVSEEIYECLRIFFYSIKIQEFSVDGTLIEMSLKIEIFPKVFRSPYQISAKIIKNSCSTGEKYAIIDL